MNAQDVFDAMERWMAAGDDLPTAAKRALDKYATPELAEPVLRDVLGPAAFSYFYVQANGHARAAQLYQEPAPARGERARASAAKNFEGSTARSKRPAEKVSVGVFQIRLGVPGFGFVAFGEVTGEMAKAYAERFSKTAGTYQARASVWRGVARRLGKASVKQKYTEKQAVALLGELKAKTAAEVIE